jgi:glutathione S-transferase
MSIKLYYLPFTRSGRVRFFLEELGVPYELVRLDAAKREHKSEAYLAIHPLGAVPGLTDGDVVLFESAAIIMYLADKFIDKGLAPPLGSPERAEYYKWIIFAMATMEPPLQIIHDQNRLPEAERDQRTFDAARARFQETAAVAERALGDREFILGAQFSAADVVLASVAGWGKAAGLLDDKAPLTAYVRRIMSRPAAKKSRAD